MGESIKIKILIAVITAIVSGSGAYFSREAKIESLAKESEQRNTRIVALENDKRNLETKYNRLENDHSRLANNYNILNTKYQKCISSSGALYIVGSLDFNNYYTRKLKTGDILEFEMTSTPIDILIKRISKSGPVVIVNGCEYYLTKNGISSTSEDRHTFYLSKEYPFLIQYSAKSCSEGNASMADYEIEEIYLKVISYNVDEQNSKIEYHRELYKK